jgi:hypothetical protein
MLVIGSDETIPNGADDALVKFLRAAARIAVPIGAVGTTVLFLNAGRRTPPLLLLMMGVWVLAPFAILAWLNARSMQWSRLPRLALYISTLVIVLGSLILYIDDAVGHRLAQAAFVYVAVPPASMVILTVDLVMATLVSRRVSGRPTPPPL